MARSEVILDPDKREAMREVIAERGTVLNINEKDRAMWPDNLGFAVDTYSPEDRQAHDHIRREKCSIIVPNGVTVTEIDYSEFEGTDTSNTEYHGLAAYGGTEGSDTEIRCGCGEQRGLTMFYQGTFGELLLATLAKMADPADVVDPSKGFTL